MQVLFLLQKYLFHVKKYGAERNAGRGFWYTFYYNSFSLKYENGTANWKSRHWHKKFYRIYFNFRKLLQFFLETSQQLLEISEVESFLSTLAHLPGSFPQNCSSRHSAKRIYECLLL